MRALLVVPLHPRPNDASCVLKRLKHVLPDAFFFEASEKPFDDPILFRCIRRDEFLLQPIVSTGLPKPPALKDHAVITPQDRRPHGPQRPEPGQTGGFHCALGRLHPTPERKLVPNHFPIMTIDHCRQMRPAVLGRTKYASRPWPSVHCFYSSN